MTDAAPDRFDWRMPSGLLTVLVIAGVAGAISGSTYPAHAQRATPQTQQKFHTHYAPVQSSASSAHGKPPAAHSPS